jgi:hypothetical protein
MGWFVNVHKQQIAKIIELLILKKTEINVRLKGEKKPFRSTFVKLGSKSADSYSKAPENQPVLIMEKVFPEQGNRLIESALNILIECVLGEVQFRFNSRYLGISSDYPYFGIVIEFPDSIEIKEQRRDDRVIPKMPDFISVEFSLGDESGKKRSYELDIVDCSKHGLGLLVTDKDIELLRILKPGDKIRDITFFATWTMIQVDAVVKHRSKIESGKHKGQYVIGVESSQIIENCNPPDSEGTSFKAPANHDDSG